jgi:chromate transporter
VWSSAIKGHADFGLALVAFGLLMFWRLPPWLVVLITAAGGVVIARFA